MDPDSVSYGKLFITIFLVLLNGFFVAAEFAIVKVRSSQLESLGKNSVVSKIAIDILHKLDAYLAATQLGITLASLALGWVGEEVMEHIIRSFLVNSGFFEPHTAVSLSGKIALPIGFFIITFLHIVLGELVPKSIAIRNPYRTTLFIATPLKLFRTIFLPLIWLFNGIANAILNLIGIRVHEEGDVHSEEELKLIISESAEGGAIEDSERELIQNVFEFDNRLVKQIFIHNSKVSGIPIEASMDEATDIVLFEGYSRYPIYNTSLDNIIGMVHSKDILKSNIHKEGKRISDIKRDVLFVNENKRVLDLLRSFQKNKTEFGVVVDEFGATIGIITMEDILEELVGEIQDEHDNETAIVEEIKKGVFRVYSLNSLDDINEFIPFAIPTDESYETLSGYIATLSEDLPKKEDVFENEYYIIRILTMNRKSPEVVELELKKKEA
jgi:CBS domain containing-hemolysin-like protein